MKLSLCKVSSNALERFNGIEDTDILKNASFSFVFQDFWAFQASQRSHHVADTCLWDLNYSTVLVQRWLSLPRDQVCLACSLHSGNQFWSSEILSTTSSRCSCTTPRNYHKRHETNQVPVSSSTPPTAHGISSAHSGGPNLDDTPHKKWGFPGSSCLRRVWMVTKKWRGKWKRRTKARFWAEGSA